MFCLSSSIATGLLVYLPVFLVEERGSEPGRGQRHVEHADGRRGAGMVLGGFAAQRFSRRLVLLAPELVLVPAILLLPSLGYAAMVPVAALAGLAMEANFSLVIVMGQEYLPARMGLSTGLLNGFCTAVAGVVVLYALGVLGDAAGAGVGAVRAGAAPAGGGGAGAAAAAARGRSGARPGGASAWWRQPRGVR